MQMETMESEAPVEEITDKGIPKPVGYRLLVMIYKAPKTFDGTQIEKPDQVQRLEDHACQVGQVIDMGSQCYLDRAKYGLVPWCRIGDWVTFRRYSGTQIRIGTTDFRILNDDQIEATVEEPRFMVRF